MRKAMIGAAKMSAVLGALALVLAFLGLYLVPVTAAGSGNSGPYFTSNVTIINPQYNPSSSNYSFMINISNSTQNSIGNVTNVTFQLGIPTGVYINYTNYTSGIFVKNSTDRTFYINFTQDQIGGAGTYNYTWFANASYTPSQGNNLNWTDTIPFTVAQNNTPINITLYLNNVSSALSLMKGSGSLNITAQTNVSGPILTLYRNSTLLKTVNQTDTNEFLMSLSDLNLGVYNISANMTAANYSSLNETNFRFTLVGPIFTGNATSNTSFQYQPASIYGFQVSITDTAGNAPGSIANVTFQLGRPAGTILTYTNYTATTNNSIFVKNNTASLFHINFTQEQIGPAGTYNLTWFANISTATVGDSWNNTQTISFGIAQNTSIGSFLTLRLDNASTNLTHVRNTVPLNITADLNYTAGADNNIVNVTFNGSVITDTSVPLSRVENATFNLRPLSFGIYKFDAYVNAGENYSATTSNYTLYLTLNSSTINFILNLTYVNSSGYVSSLNSLGGFSPQFLAQEAFTSYETGCNHANMTVNFTQTMGGVASIPVNNTCNYTVAVIMTDFISQLELIYNSTFIIGKLNATSGTGAPISADIQLVPLGTYGKASPSLKSILGGIAFNDTNIRATSSYQNVSFAIARRGYMPDGLYKCASWNQSTVGENKQVCSNWVAATTPATDFTNTTYLNKTITTQNFTFYGYSEPFYNLRPLVKAYGNASNITTINIMNWGNQRAKYYSWVPMMKFNMTSKQPYLPSSDAYAESMYYDVPFFANPSAIEMLAYNFTVNVSFASQAYNQTFGVSITPRIIRNGQTLVSGVETPLMPAWAVQDIDSFQGANTTRTILRPTFNTLYYTYNGTTCGPYLNQSNIGPGSSARVNFYNVSMAFPCSLNLSYDYSTNEMNFTVSNENVTNPSLSVLFSLAGRPTTGMYSPVYLVNQTFIGGFIPGPGQTPPSPGTASTISFMVRVNNSLSNFTTTDGKDIFIHFLYPKNVTVWQNTSGDSPLNATINISVNMGSGFQLWQLNDTVNAAAVGAINATASGDVATATGKVWMMIANETALWNASVSAYNTTLPNQQSFIVNRTFSCSNTTDSFPASPSNGKNITICFQEFDFNLTSVNGWLPNDPKSNVTLNLTATLNVSILNSLRVGSGGAGTTNQFNASISTASAGEIRLTDTQMPGFVAANCGSDFSNCSKTVIVDGSVLNTSSYRTGSIILNLASGTHAVSVSYTVPAAAAATTTTTTSSGSSSTTVSDATAGKVMKTFTSIAPYAPRTIYESELKDTNTGLTQIDISVKNIAVNVKITVEKLAGKPASITQEVVSANGKVYKFMNITKENLADNVIEKTKIRFKIEKSWLNANNFSALQIVLKRFTTQWDSLNTSKTSEDNTYIYYTADSPGFSVFAISAETPVVAQPLSGQCTENWSCSGWTECINSAQTRACADLNSCGTIANKPAESQSCEVIPAAGKPVDMNIVYAMIIIFVLLGALLYFAEKGKKKSKPEEKAESKKKKQIR